MNGDPAKPDRLLPDCPQARAVRRVRETGRVGDVVQQIVTPLLRDGHPDVCSVATMLGLSTRTLQRRLFEEGVTYARVVAQSCFAVAQWLLDDPACKVIEVALDLGYSDQAHFARAFARWTGLTPREFRRLRSTGRQAPAKFLLDLGYNTAGFGKNQLRVSNGAVPAAIAGHEPVEPKGAAR
jgi:AraC-like DNA-binding protein